MTHNGGSEGAR